MQPRANIFPTMREACRSAVHAAENKKELAADLEMVYSILLETVAEGERVEGRRHFPSDRLAELCALSQDHSPLFTLAAKLGYILLRADYLAAVAGAGKK